MMMMFDAFLNKKTRKCTRRKSSSRPTENFNAFGPSVERALVSRVIAVTQVQESDSNIKVSV